jgi:heat-inducible transcriptional repressor
MPSTSHHISDRELNLLVTLTGLYIESGEPVSSATLSKALERHGIAMPPSSVRLELQHLEHDGFIFKPHASGGRIPTSRAYRTYVDSLEPTRPNPKLLRELMDACSALSGELGRLLDYAGQVLASESGCLGFVTSPSLANARIAGFKLNPLEKDVILLRLELSSGREYHHLTKIPALTANFRLDALSELLTERLGGRRLDEVSEAEIEALVRATSGWARGYDVFVHPLHDLITDARLGEGPHTVMHGAAGLLKASGEDPDALARAVEFLDDRGRIERTLGKVAGPDEVRVLIGGDGANAIDPVLDGFAIVVATYHLHARARGRLGILGPMRIEYARNLTLVRAMSDLVSRVLIGRELTPGLR